MGQQPNDRGVFVFWLGWAKWRRLTNGDNQQRHLFTGDKSMNIFSRSIDGGILLFWGRPRWIPEWSTKFTVHLHLNEADDQNAYWFWSLEAWKCAQEPFSLFLMLNWAATRNYVMIMFLWSTILNVYSLSLWLPRYDALKLNKQWCVALWGKTGFLAWVCLRPVWFLIFIVGDSE